MPVQRKDASSFPADASSLGEGGAGSLGGLGSLGGGGFGGLGGLGGGRMPMGS